MQQRVTAAAPGVSARPDGAPDGAGREARRTGALRVCDVPLYPDAPRSDVVDDLHGRPVPDPYRWLESGDAGDDGLRATWSAQQAELYDAEAATWTTTEHWRARVGDLLKAGGVGPPAHRGDRAFFMRREPDGDMAVLWTIDPDGTERVLIDPMQLDPEGHTTLDAFQPSKEGTSSPTSSPWAARRSPTSS